MRFTRLPLAAGRYHRNASLKASVHCYLQRRSAMPSHYVRPCLEVLEDRTAPALFTFTYGDPITPTDWASPKNWSVDGGGNPNNLTPRSIDDVTIPASERVCELTSAVLFVHEQDAKLSQRSHGGTVGLDPAPVTQTSQTRPTTTP